MHLLTLILIVCYSSRYHPLCTHCIGTDKVITSLFKISVAKVIVYKAMGPTIISIKLIKIFQMQIEFIFEKMKTRYEYF